MTRFPNQPDGGATTLLSTGDLERSGPSAGSGRGQSWLKLHLNDCPSGTRLSELHLIFRADGRQHVQSITPSAPTGESNPPVIHLNLGSVAEVEWIEVWWPDLHHTRLDRPEINQVHEVRREMPREKIPVERIQGGSGQRLPDGY